MIEPGFYERIDLEAAAKVMNADMPPLDIELAEVKAIIEAALVGVQPATVEELQATLCSIHASTHPDCDFPWFERMVSGWKPVGSLSKGISE